MESKVTGDPVTIRPTKRIRLDRCQVCHIPTKGHRTRHLRNVHKWSVERIKESARYLREPKQYIKECRPRSWCGLCSRPVATAYKATHWRIIHSDKIRDGFGIGCETYQENFKKLTFESDFSSLLSLYERHRQVQALDEVNTKMVVSKLKSVFKKFVVDEPEQLVTYISNADGRLSASTIFNTLASLKGFLEFARMQHPALLEKVVSPDNQLRALQIIATYSRATNKRRKRQHEKRLSLDMDVINKNWPNIKRMIKSETFKRDLHQPLTDENVRDCLAATIIQVGLASGTRLSYFRRVTGYELSHAVRSVNDPEMLVIQVNHNKCLSSQGLLVMTQKDYDRFKQICKQTNPNLDLSREEVALRNSNGKPFQNLSVCVVEYLSTHEVSLTYQHLRKTVATMASSLDDIGQYHVAMSSSHSTEVASRHYDGIGRTKRAAAGAILCREMLRKAVNSTHDDLYAELAASKAPPNEGSFESPNPTPTTVQPELPTKDDITLRTENDTQSNGANSETLFATDRDTRIVRPTPTPTTVQPELQTEDDSTFRTENDTQSNGANSETLFATDRDTRIVTNEDNDVEEIANSICNRQRGTKTTLTNELVEKLIKDSRLHAFYYDRGPLLSRIVHEYKSECYLNFQQMRSKMRFIKSFLKTNKPG